MLKFGIKIGLAAGTVYYLNEEGIWRDSEHTVKVYEKLTSTLSPYIHEVTNQIPIEFPELPSSERIQFVTKHYWNKGVMSTFDFIQNIPEHTANLGCKTMQYINKNPELKKFIDSYKATPTTVIQEKEDKK